MPRASVEALRRNEIINGAIRLIARQGYEATTMRALAAELDVSTGTITHWFATKNQVLGAALEEVADRVARRSDDAIAGLTDPREILIALGNASIPEGLEAFEEQRVWLELAARASRTPELAERHERLYDAWRKRMERTVRAGITVGDFPDLNAAEWARTYAALIDGLALHVLLHPGAVTPAAARDAIRAHVAACARPRVTRRREQ